MFDFGESTIARIEEELRAGKYTEISLGEPVSATEIKDQADLLKYSRFVAERHVVRVKKNNFIENIIILMIIFLFVLSVLVTLWITFILKDTGWVIAPLPGLGILLTWPIRQLIRLHELNVRLAMLPESIGRLDPLKKDEQIKALTNRK